MTSRAYILLPN